MTGSRAAVRYAKAILEMAQASGAAQQVSQDMALIASTIKDNSELENFINTPNIKGEIKESALKEIFAGTQAITQGLFHLLFENKRFEILGDIASQYNA